MKPHLVILASAGTGKTWQLSGRFLGLLLDGVPPERCLATTFTRKAAGEIQDRVLERLVAALADAQKRRELEEQVGRRLTPAELARALAGLTRAMDRFRVRTLDAFFLHLAQLFSLDLGLPPEWRIAEEPLDLHLRREAVARALVDAPDDERLELLRGLSRADAARSVESVLLAAIEGGRDAFLDSDEAAWRTVRVPPGRAAAELGAAAESLRAMEVPLTKTRTPNQNWSSAHAGLIVALERNDWADFLGNGLVKKVLAGETSYSSREIPVPVREALETLLAEARHVLLAEVEHQNQATYRWLARFEAAYETVKREERAYRFDDLPKRLNPGGRDPLAERGLEPWSRLDARVEHLLLDEFQDTAPVQWRCLARLAEPLLADTSGEKSFFCVGDVKQSIYGWREAEPRLLAELRQTHPVLAEQRLTTSYRSSRVILETVDRVFERLLESGVFADRPAWHAAAEGWVREHAPHTAARELPGAALLYQAPEAVDEDPLLPCLRLAADRVRALLEESPGATIGVLLRRNEPIARMIYLLRDRGLRASGEGGNELTDSEAVLHVLSLLHLADHPTDRAALYHVQHSPLAAAVDVEQEPRALSASVRRALAVLGMGRFCARLLAQTSASYGDWDRKRFAQLVDLAYAWEDTAGLRADPFVDHVRQTRVEDPSANQIQVMTIHHAKGLEFDAVVLPELGADFLQGRRRALLTRRPTPAARLDAVSVRPESEVRRLDPHGLMALNDEQEQRDVREALCLLYVAMTRAKHCLEMIVPAKCRPGPGQVLCDLLGGVPDAQGRLWSHPESAPRWHAAPPATAAAPSAPAALAFAPPRRARVAAHRTPSAAEGAGRLEVRTLLRSPAAAARVRGLLMHRWLESIEWLEGFAASDAELEVLARPLTGDVVLARETLGRLRAALARPGLRGVLARDAQGAAAAVELEVWRERGFARVLAGAEGQDELWTGSIDRAVIERDAGRVVSARLFDFKTDSIEAREVEQRLEHYRPQLVAYRRVLADVLGLPEASVTAAAVFVELDLVRAV